MLPITSGIKTTKLNIFIYSLILFPTALSPYFFKFSGLFYLILATVISSYYLLISYKLLIEKNSALEKKLASKLFGYSILYLFMIFVFILIDKIQINEPGISLTAIKNTTINEPFFQGHFPGQPIMPGVLSLEMMAQAGSFLMLNQVDDPLTKNMFFTTVEKAKFKKPIIPGDQLTVNVDLIKKKLNLCKFHCRCNIDGALAVEGIFTANIVDRVWS